MEMRLFNKKSAGTGDQSAQSDSKAKEAEAKKRQKRKTMRAILLRTVALVVILITLNYFLTYLRQVLSVDLFFLYLPVAVASIVAYCFSISGFFLKGSLVTLVLDSAKIIVTVAVFLLLLYSTPLALPDLVKSLSYWIIAIASIDVAYGVVKKHSKPLGSLFLVVFMVIIGDAAETLTQGYFTAMNQESLAPPVGLVFLSFLIPAILSLFTFLRYSKNNYLDFLGKQLSSLGFLAIVGLLIFMIGLFELKLRPIVVPPISTYVMLVEWGTICLISLVVFVRARHYVSVVSKEFSLGRWTVLTQRTTLQKGELDEASDVVSDFINKSEKGRLITFIAQTMFFNNFNYKTTGEAFKEVVEYRDAEPPKFFLSWRMKQNEKMNRLNRLSVLEITLDRIDALIKNSSGSLLMQDYSKPMLDEEGKVAKCQNCNCQYPSGFPECPYCYTQKVVGTSQGKSEKPEPGEEAKAETEREEAEKKEENVEETKQK
jgi:hypothetical protein